MGRCSNNCPEQQIPSIPEADVCVVPLMTVHVSVLDLQLLLHTGTPYIWLFCTRHLFSTAICA